MKKKILILLLIFPILIMAQSKVFDNLTMQSSILKKEKHFSIYLPNGYETSKRSYPVLYLLHGMYGDHTSWIKLNMQNITDKLIEAGEISPLIIVMPDGETTYYLNSNDDSYRYEDYFIKELIPYIEANYRCYGGRNNRALSGLSMGGFGTMLYALHHPDMFGSAVAMSAGVRTDEEIREMPYKEFQKRFSSGLGNIKEGEERITEHYKQNSILYLLANMPEKEKGQVRFMLDCGDDDYLYKGNTQMHVIMMDKKIPHEFRMRDGAHTAEYWITGLPEALKFINKSFR